ncbi:MAG: efflux RND transporter permease subunit, partial [Planctomycetota bacterium]
MILSDFAIRNRTTVMVMAAGIILAGVMSYATLPRESAPDVEVPIIMVTTVFEGRNPEDVEALVTSKIESKLTGLKGLKEIRSISREGVSEIQVELLPGVRADEALQRVRDKVELAKGDDFPPEAEEPILTEINIAEFPIMMINISGNVSPVKLKLIADRLEDAFETVPGVLNSDVIGGLDDPDRVAAYGLTVANLVELIPSEHVNTSAGGLETGRTRFNVRVPAEFDEPVDIDTLVLTTRDGKPIYLTDVGRVVDSFKDIVSISRLNGRPSITVTIVKRIGADIIAIAETAKAVLAQARLQMPEGVDVVITMDNSDDINLMTTDLENNIASGLILVLLVLVLFMGVRTSVVVALAIPLSMLMSFAIISLIGYTLNMIVLFSLILALGMLVDNAIVIVENIYRHRQRGRSRIQAAMAGTREVAWPVIASTATTIAAFGPLLFWPGIIGDFMKYLPVTLIITLSSSLFVALIVSPVICSLLGGGKVVALDRDHWFMRGYRRILHGGLKHPILTIVAAFAILAGVGYLYNILGRGVVLFPSMDPKNAIVNVRCPQGTSIYHTDRIIRLIEHRLNTWVDSGDLKYVVANVGSGGADPFGGGGSSGPHVGNITLTFQDFEDRRRPSEGVLAEIRQIVTDIPGAEIKVEGEQGGPPTGEPINIEISGEEFVELERISDRIRGLIKNVPGLVSLRSNHEAQRPELAFITDRRRAGLTRITPRVAGGFIQTAIFGRKVGTYREFNEEYDITVRLPLAERTNIEDLFRMRVPNVFGQAVPLSTVGEFEYTGGLGNISRIDRKRVVTITGREQGRLATEVLADVQRILSDAQADGSLALSEGYRIDFTGEQEEQEEAAAFLFKAFIFACLLIVLILVAQFNTLSAPLIIMVTVGLSMVGVLVGLMV